MANNVSTYISFSFENEEAGQAKLQELYSRLNRWGEEGVYDWDLSGIFGAPESDEVDEHGYPTGPGTYQWNIDHMGVKWANIEDAEEDAMRIISAWGVPTDAINYIMSELALADPEVTANIQSEDEMPNWVYAAKADSDGIVDWNEWDISEIKERLFMENPDLVQYYNEEDDEWEDSDDGMEAESEYQSLIWEVSHDMQTEFLGY